LSRSIAARAPRAAAVITARGRSTATPATRWCANCSISASTPPSPWTLSSAPPLRSRSISAAIRASTRSCRSSSTPMCRRSRPRSAASPSARRWRMRSSGKGGGRSCWRAGGLSHYPGTPQYPHPDIDTDRVIFERLAAGNLRYLLSLDAAALDRSGNVECRSLQILAGAIGDRPPQSALFEPSWHHIYAVIGWTELGARETAALHYPATLPERSALAGAIFTLVADAEARARYRQDPALYAARCDLAEGEAAALAALDSGALRERFRVNPMLLYQLEQRLA